MNMAPRISLSTLSIGQAAALLSGGVSEISMPRSTGLLFVINVSTAPCVRGWCCDIQSLLPPIIKVPRSQTRSRHSFMVDETAAERTFPIYCSRAAS